MISTPVGDENCIETFMFNLVLPQYASHVQVASSYGGIHAWNSDLTNEILPMFLNRWATGPGQHTQQILRKIEPALQLASLFLTEDCTLSWFCRLTYGQRHCTLESDIIRSITDNAASHTPQALSQVKVNIQHVGQVMTLMFEPPGQSLPTVSGTTYRTKGRRLGLKGFKNTDWPLITPSSIIGYARPLIVMSEVFQDFFQSCDASTTEHEYYRGCLLFAISLVHEFTHAYYYWLSADEQEPLWNKADMRSELGWSWEQFMFGCEIHRANTEQDIFCLLYHLEVKEYGSISQREHILRSLCSQRTDLPFTNADATGREASPPIRDLDGEEITFPLVRQNQSATANYFASVEVVPTDWVMKWFRKDYWSSKRRAWIRSGEYSPQPFGNAFKLIYERRDDSSCTLRPLNPAFEVDKDIIDRRVLEEGTR